MLLTFGYKAHLEYPELFLNGKPCMHAIMNKSGAQSYTYSNGACTQCGILSDSSYDSDKERQGRYELFLWRMIIKKLSLEWVDVAGIQTAHLFDIKLPYDINPQRVIVVDCNYRKSYDGIFSDALMTRYMLRSTYSSISTPASRTRILFGLRSSNFSPKESMFISIVQWAYQKDISIKGYIKLKAQEEFFKHEAKNKVQRERSAITSVQIKADKFNYTEQLTVALELIKFEVEKLLKPLNISSRFADVRSSLYIEWTGDKKYLCNIYNDETLDTSGRKLYNAIVDLLGKEKADEYITTSNCVILKRLSVCILGNLVVGLCESDKRTRMAAEKLMKASL